MKTQYVSCTPCMICITYLQNYNKYQTSPVPPQWTLSSCNLYISHIEVLNLVLARSTSFNPNTFLLEISSWTTRCCLPCAIIYIHLTKLYSPTFHIIFLTRTRVYRIISALFARRRFGTKLMVVVSIRVDCLKE